MMKTIIIGASLSGKTTLVRHLRVATDWPISEIDEELTRRNGGTYPLDYKYKHEVLAPQVVQDIMSRESIVFFTNTDYFLEDDLRLARDKGFKIVQLSLNIEKLKKRNEMRVKKEGYDDLSKWLPGMLQYQNIIRQHGLVDFIIDADRHFEKIIEEIIEFEVIPVYKMSEKIEVAGLKAVEDHRRGKTIEVKNIANFIDNL